MKASIPLLLMTPAALLAGPYPADFIPAADPRFVFWASAAEIVRGPADIVEFNEEDPYFPTYGDGSSATGPADATTGDEGNPFPVVSLGDGGSATLTFAQPLADVPGPDFAVFENAFNGAFLELAHVEVSSDGVNFFRFPSSRSPRPTPRSPATAHWIPPTSTTSPARRPAARERPSISPNSAIIIRRSI